MFVGAEFNVAATLLYCLVTFPVSLFDRQFEIQIYLVTFMHRARVSVQGVKSLGGHFVCLYREFVFKEVKKNIIIFQKEKEIFMHF